MNSNVIPFDFDGQPVHFSLDGWLNATKIAARLGKEPTAWLRKIETLEYISFMAEALGFNSVPGTELEEIKALGTSAPGVKKRILELSKSTGMVRSRAGSSGGTWLHPKLAIVFARWLDTRFSVWCDLKIESILHGEMSARNQLDRACKALEDRKSQASQDGTGLSSWRWDKSPLEQSVEYWLGQVQLTLGLDAA
ncbi:KilA-N domain-containing protein [Pseudomonas helleri]|uniref:KilA-N domain-containing protein n=1 Tax=Pseudomonas helleri TaxID=1608996 RepID=UPI003FD43981